jgi:hypothetical protein
LRIELPYFDAETIDAGVKQAARGLVIFAEVLAAEASRILLADTAKDQRPLGCRPLHAATNLLGGAGG